VVLALLLAGCAKSDDDDTGANTGTGGALGTGGVMAGTGGVMAGTGGVMAGTGGVMGTGGSTGASGMGGMGSGGMGAAMTPVPGCEAADPMITGSMAHADALSVLTPMVPCAVGACHAGAGQAKLVLMGVTDLHMAIVDKPACEAPTLKIVDSQGGDAALANSWLWQKMTAPIMPGMDTLVVQASWGTAASCPSTFFPSGTMGFGDRMPYGAMNTLDAPALAKIRNWICSGAPGP
jgi:hypothetical protein